MSDQTDVVVNAPDAERVTINRDQAQDVLEALPMIVSETRKGWKTTEFWVTVAGVLLVVVDGIPLPEKLEGLVAGAIGFAYIISRGIAKKGVPAVEPTPSVEA
jgi:hypothetical protein